MSPPPQPDSAPPPGPGPSSDEAAGAALAALRADLDAVDDALHDLLMRRFSIVGRLAGSRAKTAGPAIRPGREAQILRRLLARHAGPLPKASLIQIWREVLAASIAMQGNFTVAAFARDPALLQLTREHFGAATPLRAHPTPARALAAVTEGEASVAVLPVPAEGEAPEALWWTYLDAPRLHVVARLPFFRPRPDLLDGEEALMISSLPPDPTGEDRSLLRLEDMGSERSRDSILRALTAAGLAPRTLLLRREGGGPTRCLAEVDGYVAAGDPRLAALAGFARAESIGAYAVPATGD